MTTKIIHNVETGEIKEVELTKAELAELAKNETADAAKMAERVAAIATKEAIIAKLGLTADEVADLLL
jgi:phage FluMu protein gp41